LRKKIFTLIPGFAQDVWVCCWIEGGGVGGGGGGGGEEIGGEEEGGGEEDGGGEEEEEREALVLSAAQGPRAPVGTVPLSTSHRRVDNQSLEGKKARIRSIS
jgi:hypothetical protein